jgi:repressor LexA
MSTDFQENLHKFISEHLALYGQSPGYKAMTVAMGISSKSKSLITRSLKALNKEGKILLKKQGRKIVITLTPKGLPLVGKISAGVPIEAIEENQFIDIKELLEGESRFALQVKGNSMIDDGIFDGDFIICKKAQIANEGDIIVALIDQMNTTLKRVSFKMKGMITLIPSNIEMKPRAYPAERIQIQGIYIGLLRLN